MTSDVLWQPPGQADAARCLAARPGVVWGLPALQEASAPRVEGLPTTAVGRALRLEVSQCLDLAEFPGPRAGSSGVLAPRPRPRSPPGWWPGSSAAPTDRCRPWPTPATSPDSTTASPGWWRRPGSRCSASRRPGLALPAAAGAARAMEWRPVGGQYPLEPQTQVSCGRPPAERAGERLRSSSCLAGSGQAVEAPARQCGDRGLASPPVPGRDDHHAGAPCLARLHFRSTHSRPRPVSPPHRWRPRRRSQASADHAHPGGAGGAPGLSLLSCRASLKRAALALASLAHYFGAMILNLLAYAFQWTGRLGYGVLGRPIHLSSLPPSISPRLSAKGSRETGPIRASLRPWRELRRESARGRVLPSTASATRGTIVRPAPPNSVMCALRPYAAPSGVKAVWLALYRPSCRSRTCSTHVPTASIQGRHLGRIYVAAHPGRRFSRRRSQESVGDLFDRRSTIRAPNWTPAAGVSDTNVDHIVGSTILVAANRTRAPRSRASPGASSYSTGTATGGRLRSSLTPCRLCSGSFGCLVVATAKLSGCTALCCFTDVDGTRRSGNR